jgi:DNA repair exonuclease SbcCD ATPase subunit
MITLKKLQWSNCFSYGPNNELDLDANTVTQIIGTNGMGKSSIPLIIEEALYNKNSKGIKKADIPNRYINNGYDICLSFTRDSDEYVITINRKSNIKLKLEKNGEDISSHTATNTYKTIQEIIGIDFKTFSQLVYQNTNASLQFLTATDTNRKKFLIELLSLEKYVELFDLFKDAAREIALETASVQSTVNTIEKWLKDNKLSDTTILPMLDILIDTEEDEKEYANLTAEIKNISEKNKKISKNNTYKTLLKELDNEKSTVQFAATFIKGSYDSEQSEIGSLKQIAAGSKRFIEKLKNLEGVCPTCEQPVDEALRDSMLEAEREKGASALKKIGELQEFIEKIKEDNEHYENYQRIEREWRETFRSIDESLPSSPLDEGELNSRLRRVRNDLDRAKAEVGKITKENEERTRRNTRIQVILEQTKEFQEQLEVCLEKMEGIKNLSANLEVLKKAFSTNGLVAYKIENLVKELEELANHYLAELSDGRFTLEFVVSNDKLNVEITDNGNIVDILALSSGELARVNTATLIAIRKLMSSISKSRINVLFLDEVINVLDELGREKMVEVLLEEELNTYIVSHGWTHPLLEKVEVVKCDNVSKLEY